LNSASILSSTIFGLASSTIRCGHVAFNAARGTVNGSYSKSSLASDGNRLGADNRSTHANACCFSGSGRGAGTSVTTFAVLFLPYARRFTLISIWRPVNDGGSFFSLLSVSGRYGLFKLIATVRKRTVLSFYLSRHVATAYRI